MEVEIPKGSSNTYEHDRERWAPSGWIAYRITTYTKRAISPPRNRLLHHVT